MAQRCQQLTPMVMGQTSCGWVVIAVGCVGLALVWVGSGLGFRVGLGVSLRLLEAG